MTLKDRFRILLEFGVSANISDERASTVRAVNIILLTMIIVALSGTAGWWILAWYYRARLNFFDFGIVQLVLGMSYALCLMLNGVGFHFTARFAGLVVAAMHFFLVNAVLPDEADILFWGVLGAIGPVLIFSKDERKLLIITYTAFFVSIMSAEFFKSKYPPDTFPTALITTQRFLTLFLVITAATSIVYYYRMVASQAEAQLETVNHRLRELLANTLPPLIIGRLNGGETLIANSHSEVTVLFGDIVGFTELTKRISPSHLVELLNKLFSRFDEAAEQYQVEKIKTIGDCYMAATGLLSEGEQQVAIIAEFALRMMQIVEEMSDEFGHSLKLRIGMATGPVISGVIGQKKYAYDVWGDTVNLASRMESNSEVGAILVNEIAYYRLVGRFRLQKRDDDISVKGYATPLRVYTLLGRNLEAVDAASELELQHPRRL